MTVRRLTLAERTCRSRYGRGFACRPSPDPDDELELLDDPLLAEELLPPAGRRDCSDVVEPLGGGSPRV